ncbi:CDP-glucose 4,6-dehydratase [Phaeocystidibacter marisrubri]|uniref:CDP-glucose 4,6-dehydratase n=1 Tax=Phaeocystidibacter marisrubri TaxID=1577780 RepID=A0A6L3ZJ67_9FLAO|nr:CDP-glucose 4,6-dehydratase [Phaeocystidibacter marisrubri]KAB2817598.1 CDP-glucose 4,6-dehydratase [Phaeocystidibacter marisrubri]GGH74561.1 CDP-glucose 4,6-dehydratase [Phaeocystidibacter marisrubri]
MKFLEVYRGKKVIVTGHTGFKGSWMSYWLHSVGAHVVGIGLDPKREEDLYHQLELSSKIVDYREDIRNLSKMVEIFEAEQPDFVFHMAAQALVIDGYNDPVYTYEVNVTGTANILEALRSLSKKAVGVFITTDKVYENKEWEWPYRESDELGGYDPYSSSKAAAEILIQSFRKSFFNPNSYDDHLKSVASVRAGNVIGGGDWSDNRIVPDCMKSIQQSKDIELRSPLAVRPWQHVLEPIGGYLLLGAKMFENPTELCEAFNFGPEAENVLTVKDLVDGFVKLSGKVSWIDVSDKKVHHEANLLTLDINKAKKRLNWHPILGPSDTIKYTFDWYMSVAESGAEQLCSIQINDYSERWNSKRES